MKALALAGALVLGGSMAVQASDIPPPGGNVCLRTMNIRNTSTPDDKTIIFHMRGGPIKTWRNDLQRECQGLSFERGIAWTIWGNEVCENMQIFYVLRRGTPCGLGKFTPVETPPPAAN